MHSAGMHHVYVLQIHRSEAGMRKTGAQSLTAWLHGDRERKHRTRQYRRTPGVTIAVVELSGREVEAAR
jgi:hypothetical protein